MTDVNWLPTGDHWGLHISRKVVSTGPMVKGGHKIIWHTTEGSGLDGADTTLRSNGDEPHFLLDTHSGKCIQYVALREFSKALRHPNGTPETNRAGCIQVELVGFARETPKWTDAQLRKIAGLACLIEHRVSVPRHARAKFAYGAPRLSAQVFPDAAGHLGHMHVPNNDHVDPGALNIQRVFELMAELNKGGGK